MMNKRIFVQFFFFSLGGLMLLAGLFFLFLILYFLIQGGAGVISWEFLTGAPRMGMSAGGILPAIVGPLSLTVGALLFAAPLGILSAIYLTEYTRGGRLVNFIRVAINNLSGVPSVVFGLFGFTFFVKYLGFGVSILSGSLTLAIVILPVIIRTTEEALLMVPSSYREGALSLGADTWQVVSRLIVPSALPGILTGCIIGVGRVAGETAPILFTAVTFFKIGLPGSIFEEVLALPYHIYALLAAGTNPAAQVPIAYGSALVLVSLVLLVNLIAVILRIHWGQKFQAR